VDVSELGLSEEDFEIVEIANAQGDVNLTDPLYNMGQIGVFTKSVEIEL
jgi:porphobilinogen deaminase